MNQLVVNVDPRIGPVVTVLVVNVDPVLDQL